MSDTNPNAVIESLYYISGSGTWCLDAIDYTAPLSCRLIENIYKQQWTIPCPHLEGTPVETLLRTSAFDISRMLDKKVYHKLEGNLDLSSFSTVRSLLSDVGGHVVMTEARSGASGCCFRMPGDEVALCINGKLDDDEKIVVALHEFCEHHLDGRFSFLNGPDVTDMISGDYLDNNGKDGDRFRNHIAWDLVNRFFHGFVRYFLIEYGVWFYCLHLILCGRSSEESRKSLAGIICNRLSDTCVSLSVANRYILRLFALFGDSEWLPPIVDRKVAAELLGDIAAVSGDYIKFGANSCDKELLFSKESLEEKLNAWERLKELLEK